MIGKTMGKKVVTDQMLDDLNTSLFPTVESRRALIDEIIRDLQKEPSPEATKAIAELRRRKRGLTV